MFTNIIWCGRKSMLNDEGAWELIKDGSTKAVEMERVLLKTRMISPKADKEGESMRKRWVKGLMFLTYQKCLCTLLPSHVCGQGSHTYVSRAGWSPLYPNMPKNITKIDKRNRNDFTGGSPNVLLVQNIKRSQLSLWPLFLTHIEREQRTDGT